MKKPKAKEVKPVFKRKKKADPIDDVDSPPPAGTPPLEVKRPDRSALKDPLGEGQRYFEAPSGKIYVGPVDVDRMLVREDGKEMWINPKR